MALPDQFLSPIGDDAFRSSVTLQRHTFIEGGDLRDSHAINRSSAGEAEDQLAVSL